MCRRREDKQEEKLRAEGEGLWRLLLGAVFTRIRLQRSHISPESRHNTVVLAGSAKNDARAELVEAQQTFETVEHDQEKPTWQAQRRWADIETI